MSILVPWRGYRGNLHRGGLYGHIGQRLTWGSSEDMRGAPNDVQMGVAYR